LPFQSFLFLNFFSVVKERWYVGVPLRQLPEMFHAKA
jgi:hypothetical protein